MKASVGFFAGLAVILTATPMVAGLWGSHHSDTRKGLYRRDEGEAVKIIQSVIDDIPDLVNLIKKTKGLFEKLKELQDSQQKKRPAQQNNGDRKNMKQGNGSPSNNENKPKWWDSVWRMPEGWNFRRMFGNNGNAQTYSYAFSS